MQYTRLINALTEECIAASLGGYDVEDVLAGKEQGGDLVREVLVLAVCDPRFKRTVRATRAWQDKAQEMLESFAQELTDISGLTREEALERLDKFLDNYFFTMVRRGGSGKRGSAIVRAEGGPLSDGTETDDEDEGARRPVGSSRELENALGAFGGKGSDERVCSREEQRQAELQYLRNIPASLRRLAALIGRSGSEDRSPAGRFLTASKSDIAGITVGNDLSNVLPSEIALLGHPATEDIFLKNYVAKQLQVFASASSGGDAPVRRQDGPVILCLDRSSSMDGHPSDLARAITVAVTILAKREHREVIVVVYGDTGDREVFNVKNLRTQRQDFVRFLNYSCSGGNDEDTLFRWLFTEVLPADKAFDSGDVLCVSDFGWSSVSPEVMELIRINKAKGMKFYGLNIDEEGLETFMVSEIIDSMWIWDERKSLCYEDNEDPYAPQRKAALPDRRHACWSTAGTNPGR